MDAENRDRETGSVVISIDAELGWGFYDHDEPPDARVEGGRNGWNELAALLDRYEIPATWAIVGHLLLDDCDGRHADHPAGEEWFHRERGEWAGRGDLRFGNGLVERVRSSPVDHEVACHTFSHVEFGNADTSRQVARAELQRSRDVFEAHGFSPTSLVFPRNRVGHRDLLPEFGFDAYRGVSPTSRSAFDKATDAVFGAEKPPLVRPTVDEHGLVDVPASQYLFDFEGAFHRLAEHTVGDPVVDRARKGIDAATRSDGVFHMWLHPNNLTGPLQVRRCRQIFEYLDEKRDEVRIQTMADVAAAVEEDEMASTVTGD